MNFADAFKDRRLDGLQQQIYLSLLGGEAWRLYREEGLHPTLLADMHPWGWDPDVLCAPMVATMVRFTGAPANKPHFHSRVALALHGDNGRWHGSGFGQFGMYWQDEAGNWLVNSDHTLPGIDLDAEDQFNLVVLAAGVGSHLYSEVPHGSPRLTDDHAVAVRQRLAPLWFEVCDAVLTA